MGKIGNFGKLITFETSDEKILNFNNFSKSTGAKWSTQERIGKKPTAEFMGAELQKVSFDIRLNAQRGVRPRSMIEKIENAIETGQVEILVIGSKKVGENRWIIRSMSQTWDTILDGGELMAATLQLTLEEYI